MSGGWGGSFNTRELGRREKHSSAEWGGFVCQVHSWADE